MKFTIHYTEKGDGQIIRGKVYNGKRRMTLPATSEENAIKKLKSQYVEDGIKEITKIELVQSPATDQPDKSWGNYVS